MNFEQLWLDIDDAYKRYVFPVCRLLNIKPPDLMIIADREDKQKIKFACARATIVPDSNGIIKNIKPMHIELYVGDIIRGCEEWKVKPTDEIIILHSIVTLIHEVYHIYQYTHQKKIFIGTKLLDDDGFDSQIRDRIEKECEIFTRNYIQDNIIHNELIRRINDMEDLLSRVKEFKGRSKDFFKELNRLIKLINLQAESDEKRVIFTIGG